MSTYDYRHLEPFSEIQRKDVPIFLKRIASLLLPFQKQIPFPVTLRLLKLLAGVEPTPLVVQLSHASLTDFPDYEALSYAWGDSRHTDTVRCGERRLPVAANLHAALKHLRLPHATRVLWIDALCINQDDVQEREEQVKVMRYIYASARRVVIWLGEADGANEGEKSEKARQAIIFVQKLAHLFRRPGLDILKQPALRWAFAEKEIKDLDYSPLRDLLRKPWFRRAWVAQEVAKARDAVLLYGREQIAWELFSSVVISLQDFGLGPVVTEARGSDENMLTIDRAVANIMHLQNFRDAGETGFDLLILSALMGSFDSKDPRDKLYALIGLARRSQQFSISVGYVSTPVEVFKNFTIFQLMEEKSLRCLCLASRPASVSKLLLPSWVPDWTIPLQSDPNFPYPRNFQAGTAAQPVIHLSHDNTILNLKGKLVDTICLISNSTGIVPPLDGLDEIDRFIQVGKLLQSVLDESYSIAVATLGDVSHGLSHDIYLRTLILDRTIEFDCPDQACLAHFEPFYKHLHKFLTEIIKGLHIDELEEGDFDHAGITASYGSLGESYEIIHRNLMKWSMQRRFCGTKAGRLGWLPLHADVGDEVCVFLGAELPFVIRPEPGRGSRFQLVGDCYVHGLMDGEALDDTEIAVRGISLY